MKHGSITSHLRRMKSKQRTERGESAPKKVKTIQFAGKVMASVFCDARGIINIDYPQKGKTINDEYYAKLLRYLTNEIKKNSRIWRRRKCFFIKTMHRSFFVRLALSDFLSPNLK